jgi:hypothetical protein
MSCGQAEQPLGHGLNVRLSHPGRTTARMSPASSARLSSAWLGRTDGSSHAEAERSTELAASIPGADRKQMREP